MKSTQITIAGNKVSVAYCYATEIAFQKMSGVSIDAADFQIAERSAILIMAAVMAYYQSQGQDAPVEDKVVLYQASPQELIDAIKAVFELRRQWYDLPAGEEDLFDKEEESEEAGGEQKND